jgi:hypothetical protein
MAKVTAADESRNILICNDFATGQCASAPTKSSNIVPELQLRKG